MMAASSGQSNFIGKKSPPGRWRRLFTASQTLQCGRVEEFFDSEIEKRQTRIATDRGFSLREHSLSLYAECKKPDCENRKKFS